MLHNAMDLASHIIAHDANSSQSAAGVPILTIAGATEDAVEVTGLTIDRYDGTAIADSAVLATMFNATLANTKTIAFAIAIEESDDNSTWASPASTDPNFPSGVVQASTVAATGDGVSTEFVGMVQNTIPLRDRKRYVRFNVTPDLSATGTDEAFWSSVAILGGYDQLPK